MIAACGQMEATPIDQAASVWATVERLAAQASRSHADLFVLPEATYPAYRLESVDRYRRCDIERSTAVLGRFAEVAARHAFWLVAGFVEEQGDKLYNSAAVFDRTGTLVGVARKNFLWDQDHRWFTAGDSLTVLDSEFGRMGLLICADARMPEIPATLICRGAQFLVMPTAWVNCSEVRRTYRNIQPDFLIKGRSTEFGVPFICSSKSGREAADLEYVGQSRIVASDGTVQASAPIGGEHVVVAEVSPTSPPPLRLDAAQRRRLLSSKPPFRPEVPGGECSIPLRVGLDEVAAALQAAGARVARLDLSDLSSFAPARCHALDGAQVLLVRGRVLDDATLRTRAAENRVFVILAMDTVSRVVDPDGTEVWREADWGSTLKLDLARADLKRFTPATDLWDQRRVSCYRLDAEQASTPAPQD